MNVQLAYASNIPDGIQKPMLLWTDPPYGTGKTRTGPKGSYYDDMDTDYVIDALEAWSDIMHDNGTMVICCDYRLVRNVLNLFADIGWAYMGEVIWEFHLGRPRMSWWPVRHNNILTFTKNGKFDSSAIPRTKRLAAKPGYGDDKPSGSVWEKTMSNTDPERVGYPNQKPLSVVEPFVLAHTSVGDMVVDPFCGSGTTLVAAKRNGRLFYGSDNNPKAIDVTIERVSEA